jgi:hypothetical protein
MPLFPTEARCRDARAVADVFSELRGQALRLTPISSVVPPDEAGILALLMEPPTEKLWPRSWQ